MENSSYQNTTQWLKENIHAPFTTVVYVAAVAFVVKVKNFFSGSDEEVLVEIYKKGAKLPFTKIFLPRICIIERISFEKEIKELIENIVEV